METHIRFIKSVLKVNPLPVAAVRTTGEVKLIYSNGIAEKLLGYSKEELFKLSVDNFRQIIHPDDFEKLAERTRQLLSSKEGEIISFDVRIKKADGDYLVWLTRDIVFERDDDGSPLKYTSVMQDITEVVQLEKNISRLVQKLNMISYKNSHDLRGPVASILGLMEVMKMENFQSVYNQKIFQHLEATVSKLDKIVQDISDISYH